MPAGQRQGATHDPHTQRARLPRQKVLDRPAASGPKGLLNSQLVGIAPTHATEIFRQERQLGTLDRLLGAGPSLLGGSASTPAEWGAADCAVQAYLAYLPLFCPQVDLAPYPHVQASIETTRQRAAYQLAMGQS
jgi:glutathione S-transferase